MSVVIIGVPQLQRRLKAIEHGRPLLQEIQIRAVREAKLRVARATGFTGRTIRPGDLNDRFAIVEAGGAAVFLEHGTRPHIIRPRNKSVLSWTEGKRLSGRNRTGAGAGQRIFARVVRHPGTKAQPFLLPGAVEAVKQVGVRPIVDAWNSAA